MLQTSELDIMSSFMTKRNVPMLSCLLVESYIDMPQLGHLTIIY